jgi:hypothetical protein
VLIWFICLLVFCYGVSWGKHVNHNISLTIYIYIYIYVCSVECAAPPAGISAPVGASASPTRRRGWFHLVRDAQARCSPTKLTLSRPALPPVARRRERRTPATAEYTILAFVGSRTRPAYPRPTVITRRADAGLRCPHTPRRGPARAPPARTTSQTEMPISLGIRGSSCIGRASGRVAQAYCAPVRDASGPRGPGAAIPPPEEPRTTMRGLHDRQ